MLTTDERIRQAATAVIDHFGISGAAYRNDVKARVESMIRESLGLTWLDQPDGPGDWWVRRGDSEPYLKFIGKEDHDFNSACVYQRVLGPSVVTP